MYERTLCMYVCMYSHILYLKDLEVACNGCWEEPPEELRPLHRRHQVPHRHLCLQISREIQQTYYISIRSWVTSSATVHTYIQCGMAIRIRIQMYGMYVLPVMDPPIAVVVFRFPHRWKIRRHLWKHHVQYMLYYYYYYYCMYEGTRKNEPSLILRFAYLKFRSSIVFDFRHICSTCFAI